jgi:NDP-sugar pyrophosphorylase family protein
MKGIVLATGEGLRLRPYTKIVKKELITINGIPIIGHNIDKLLGLGIYEKNICVVLGYLKEELIGFVNRYYKGVTCVNQDPTRKGTAIALQAARDFIGDDYFMMIYGDLYFQDDLRQMPRTLPTITTAEVKDVSSFGKVTSIDDSLVSILEKTETGSGDIFSGVIVEPSEFLPILDRIEPNPKTGEYYVTDAILRFNRDWRHRVYRMKGFWSDVGTPKGLKKARRYTIGSK